MSARKLNNFAAFGFLIASSAFGLACNSKGSPQTTANVSTVNTQSVSQPQQVQGSNVVAAPEKVDGSSVEQAQAQPVLDKKTQRYRRIFCKCMGLKAHLNKQIDDQKAIGARTVTSQVTDDGLVPLARRHLELAARS